METINNSTDSIRIGKSRLAYDVQHNLKATYSELSLHSGYTDDQKNNTQKNWNIILQNTLLMLEQCYQMYKDLKLTLSVYYFPYFQSRCHINEQCLFIILLCSSENKI